MFPPVSALSSPKVWERGSYCGNQFKNSYNVLQLAPHFGSFLE